MTQNLQAFTLQKDNVLTYNDPQLWCISPDKQSGLQFKVSQANDRLTPRTHIYEDGIIAFNARKISAIAGSATVWSADIVRMTKLQAFIDFETPKIKTSNNRKRDTLGFSSCTFVKPPSHYFLTQWLCFQNAHKNENSRKIIAVLQNTEWYWVVHYLLTHASSEKSLQSLSEHYGVSVSHFRRLCKTALNQAAKVEICQWRLARSIIDVIEGDLSITEIAYKQGYASLSHFSNDAKINTGYSPMEMKKIISQ